MKVLTPYVRSKLGTRIALLFVLCALVPILLLSVLAFNQVIGQLKDIARHRLRTECRTIAQSMVERLSALERELALASQVIDQGEDVQAFITSADGANEWSTAAPFLSVNHWREGQDTAVRLGGRIPVPELNDEQKGHLTQGRGLLLAVPGRGQNHDILMLQSAGGDAFASNMIGGLVNPDYLWSSLGEFRPGEISQLCVVDQRGKAVYSYAPMSGAFLMELRSKIESASVDLFDWKEHGRIHFVGYRNLFLGQRYGVSRWTVVATRPVDKVLAPIAPFRKWFPLLVMLCIWVVLFLTLFEVRRQLIPLNELIKGANRVADKDFDVQVNLETNDEFHELAEAFNSMTLKLGRQFRTLDAITEIDRSLLMSVNMEEIARLALTGLANVFNGCGACISLINSVPGEVSKAFVTSRGLESPRVEEIPALSERECLRLEAAPHGVQIEDRHNLPPYLEPLRDSEGLSFIVLPVIVKDRLEGVVCLDFDRRTMVDSDLEHLRQLGNQIALAIANAKLLETLQRRNWGIVHALARAVDAKSPWTSGHSERVARVSVLLARELGYNEEQLEELERGALLHDIGKIGISSEIIDKPGPLSDEERMIIRDHPRMGRVIIEPIGASDEILNIISQHHERFDGNGYPLGLSSDTISMSGRIVAVADVMDAVCADRPYRKGMAFQDAVEVIMRDSGAAFDPQVVAAYATIIEGHTDFEGVLDKMQLSSHVHASLPDLKGNTP